MDHTRHLGIFQVPLHFKVGIVGAGGIGAMTALVLSKMGVVQLTVWDDDTVSEVNVPTQLHAVDQIGSLKVDSLRRTLEQFSDEILLDTYAERVDENTVLTDHYNLFITAVDSITARQQIWQAVQRADIEWLCDLRMAAEQFQLFLVNMQNAVARERYDIMLMSLGESSVEELPCTMRATFFCASTAAGHAGVALRNILRGEASSQRLVHYLTSNTIYTFNL